MPPTSLEAVARSICADKNLRFQRAAGAGAFKETFLIELADGTPQALKVYRPGASPERANREIQAMLLCSHPNIGRLTAIDQHQMGTQTFLYSLEEYLPGGTLGERLQAHGLLSDDEVHALGASLIAAVAHIAALGLVHRDIKPDNILLRADGYTPVLVDFGLVRNLAEYSLTQSWLIQGPGTPYYAPAEQLNNEKAYIDWRADQFSLGVVLSESLFGFHPYQDAGESPYQVVARVGQRLPQVRRFHDAASTRIFPELIKMTAPWPVERYRKPEELIAAWAARQGRS